jgi:hypothetical protein
MITPPTESQLAADLAQAERIKAEMEQLLRELETAAAGHSIPKSGAWRHHPTQWATSHLPRSEA